MPLPATRALAMMHLAMHDAVNAAAPRYATYAIRTRDQQADPAVAAAQAAHDVLATVYPGQKAALAMYHPFGQIFFGMRLPLLLQRQKAAAAIRKIHSWQPQGILLSHGRCFDADADKIIRRIFGEPRR